MSNSDAAWINSHKVRLFCSPTSPQTTPMQRVTASLAKGMGHKQRLLCVA